jgi:hypothetical protein
VTDGPAPLSAKNFILNRGLAATRDALIGPAGGGFVGSFYRMAIGDGGCPAGQLFSPRQPDSTWPGRTGLYHEVIRQDISVLTRPTPNSMRFVGSFNSGDIDPSSYSVADRVINEAALKGGHLRASGLAGARTPVGIRDRKLAC